MDARSVVCKESLTVRILIVDEDPIARAAVRARLEESGGFEIVGELADHVDATASAAEIEPDLIVMEIPPARFGGVSLIADVVDAVPDAGVVVFSSSADQEVALRTLRAGASGFLTKAADLDGLPRALEIAHRREAAV